MEKEFDIQTYMTNGVLRIVKDSLKSTLKNPKESLFLTNFMSAVNKASLKRRATEDHGEHIPPFIIASITSNCNLHCIGCYSRCNKATTDEKNDNLLDRENWKKIFEEASEIGISFILLAGGEPLLRKDVIEEAFNYKDIVFPIFTNGTFVNDYYLDLFDDNRNLIPIVSIEGEKEATDSRRGIGVYDRVVKNINEFDKRKLLYGVSITVTKNNLNEVTSSLFIKNLYEKGVKIVIYVEYVPIDEKSKNIAVNDDDRIIIKNNISKLRNEYGDLIFISFPGDEKNSDGCIAAGRGFFHISATGNAEPCPFSPYSDVNIKNTTLREALKSKLFTMIRDGNLLKENHSGGCILFEKKDEVEKLVNII